MLGDMLNIKNCIRLLKMTDKQEMIYLKRNSLAFICEELPHINTVKDRARQTYRVSIVEISQSVMNIH